MHNLLRSTFPHLAFCPIPRNSASTMTSAQPFRLSGHQTFPCRYAWLPKAVRCLDAEPNLFSDEDNAMVRLGVGKNMVAAIRFWAESAQVFEVKGGLKVSESWGSVLRDGGFDPYLERVQTLWLIHW